MAEIATVGEDDLAELLPLMRAYCDFYAVDPSDEELLALSRSLLADPREGFQLLARDDSGAAIAFATVYLTFSTLAAAPIGIMNDLFVAPAARGTGVADALIAACAERVRAGGGRRLEWNTARDNLRAQAVYDRSGANRDEDWLSYSLQL